MPKHKAGLHKQVSSIFTGIPIPKDDDAKRLSSTATEEPQSYGPPSHLSGRAVESPQPTKSPHKTIPAEKPKDEGKKKAAKIQAPPEIKPARPAVFEQTVQRIKDKLFAPKEGVSPTRQKAMVVLVPVLFIGMVLAFVKVLGSGPSKTDGPKIFKPPNPIAAAASTIDWLIPPPYPTTLRDPMQFVSATTVDQDEPGGLIVKGIVYSEDSSFAIIGTEIVHEGGTVSGATVVKINPDSVEFEMNGKRWTQKVQ
jgi:hypothetical protein